ncbi:MAG: cysteine desulfurase-like protein [Acidimicrobiia bacterium]|nr:cysteine desulfurase-like protein [Acidimicrobiia bacterium]MDH3396552.1 cysteine desulfurase-like protein [Acidimicrobiia bacterium]MDH5614989.1 cysteine desulfurase-like protein [Acidimicrobiia bacterium]
MFDPHDVRPLFPALQRTLDGEPVVYLDGPGGTQTPRAVSAAMAGVLDRGISNLGGSFASSREADVISAAARSAIADLINSGSNEIAFGQNMTSLTFAVSRALARTWQAGDEIVVTRLDHDANITPWLVAAEERGVTVRWLDFLPESGYDLDYSALDGLLRENTRLVAVTHASNALGTIVDVARVVEAAHSVGARVFVDAVHYTPHRLVDVQSLDCDFLVASAYKFFGPHTGFLYGRHELLAQLEAYKVRPAPSDPPGKWETGTQSFESLAGVSAAVDYLASPGGSAAAVPRRAALQASMEAIGGHEKSLAAGFLSALENLEGVTVHGPTHKDANRTPTFAVAVAGLTPDEVQRRLGERGIFVWSGHYYAVEVMRRLGLLEAGGLVRIGFVNYNTTEELARVIDALDQLRVGTPQ